MKFKYLAVLLVSIVFCSNALAARWSYRVHSPGKLGKVQVLKADASPIAVPGSSWQCAALPIQTQVPLIKKDEIKEKFEFRQVLCNQGKGKPAITAGMTCLKNRKARSAKRTFVQLSNNPEFNQAEGNYLIELRCR